jgi:hypothetical protein
MTYVENAISATTATAQKLSENLLVAELRKQLVRDFLG